MAKRKIKALAANPETPTKVHVYLLVPEVLHEWLMAEARDRGFKNVQEAILHVLRSAREARQEQAAA